MSEKPKENPETLTDILNEDIQHQNATVPGPEALGADSHEPDSTEYAKEPGAFDDLVNADALPTGAVIGGNVVMTPDGLQEVTSDMLSTPAGYAGEEAVRHALEP